MKHLFFILFLAGLTKMEAQKLILQEIPEKILKPPVYGIRGIHYIHFFYEAGLISGKGGADTLKFSNIRSSAFNFGLRYKGKLSRKLAFISDASYRFRSYYIRQSNNRFPDTLQYKKEKLNFNQAAFSMGFRTIYGRKKTYFGYYLEAGALYAWNFVSTHYTKQVLKNAQAESTKQIVRIRNKNLKYISDFQTEVYCALGFEKIQFRFQYRISDIFEKHGVKEIPELPRLIIGVNISVTGN